MLLEIKKIGSGLHPSEAIVEVQTEGGQERLVVDSDSIKGGLIEVGSPVGKRNEHFLIELPRETFRGVWRVWVSRSLLKDNMETAA